MYILFRNRFSFFLYDSNKSDIQEISSETYSLIKNNKKSIQQKKLQELIGKGYLTNKRHEIVYPNQEFIADLLDRSISEITIQITQRCNLRCRYCAFTENVGNNRNHADLDIDWETIKSILDYVRVHSIDSHTMVIGFYGGEPFLNYEILERAVNYAEEIFQGKQLSFTVTTNSTMLNEKILNFLENHKFSLTLSIDGPKYINDFNRRFASQHSGSYESVKNTIKNIVNHHALLKLSTSINMVLDPRFSIAEFQKIYDEIPEVGELRIIAGLVDDTSSIEKFGYNQKFIEEMEYEIFIERLHINDADCIAFQHKKRLLEIFTRQSLIKAQSIIGNRSGSPAGPCIPGYMKLFANVCGVFYPCEKVSETANDLILGDS